MTNGQVACPLVIRTANGGGIALRRPALARASRTGRWPIPGPQGRRAVDPGGHEGPAGGGDPRSRPGRSSSSTRRSTRPRARCPTASTSCTLGRPRSLREGDGLPRSWRSRAMVPRRAGGRRAARARTGSTSTVIDLRWLVPLDTQTILASVAQDRAAVHGRGEPAAVRLGRRGRVDRGGGGHRRPDGPIVRITAPHVPLPAAENLEALVIPSWNASRTPSVAQLR